MRIEIISTGDEIVTGLVVDTNAAWLSALLLEQGWQVRRRLTVGDNLADLKAALQESAEPGRGGAGVRGASAPPRMISPPRRRPRPSSQPLTLFPDWLATMAERYASRGRIMAQSNSKQAWLPRDCEILDNPVGTACGFLVSHPASHGQSRLFFTPGVPFEFKQMVREQILPRLKQLAGAQIDTELRRFTPSASRSRRSAICWMPTPGQLVLSWVTAPPCPLSS